MQQFTVSVLPNGKFLLFLSLFGMLAIKAMAFCKILIFSQQNLPFLKCVKWLCKYFNTILLSTPIFKCNILCIYAICLVNKNFFYKCWYCPYYIHTRCSMLVQYPIVSILCLYTNTHSVYTVCFIEVYSTHSSALSSHKILVHHVTWCYWSFFISICHPFWS